MATDTAGIDAWGTRVAAAVLAAGAGTRFVGGGLEERAGDGGGGGVEDGGDRTIPKLLAPLGGRSLLSRALDAPVAAGCTPVIAVVANRSSPTALHAADHPGVSVVENRRSAEGMATSMQAAVAALRGLDSDIGSEGGTGHTVGACCFALGDQPLIGAESYRRLSEAFVSGARLAVATYGARRGHPVLIARSLWSDLDDLSGDRGARELLERTTVSEVACDGTGSAVDVDTMDELRALEAEWRSATPSP
ncbi:MAG: nucleotidyltransferase family protein [Acidimicrobiia bacterium]|nr:nucleotidyltransferase family protein [Acidimicrobiia bacterium]